MSEADSENCIGLIYTTNILRPLGKDADVGDFLSNDRWIEYNELSNVCKNAIDTMMNESGHILDKDKLSIRLIGFTGQSERNLTEVVYNNIDKFVSKAKISQIINNDNLFASWLDIVTFNSEDENKTKTLKKEDIVWLLIEGQLAVQNPHFDIYDDATRQELERLYGDLINHHVERLDQTTKILSAYNKWSQGRIGDPNLVKEFIDKEWKNYRHYYESPGIDDILNELITKIILEKTINLRYFVTRMKTAAGLP